VNVSKTRLLSTSLPEWIPHQSAASTRSGPGRLMLKAPLAWIPGVVWWSGLTLMATITGS